MTDDMKWCCRCKTALPRSEFNRNRNTKDGKQTYCRPCSAEDTAERRRKWSDAQFARAAATNRAYRQTAKHREARALWHKSKDGRRSNRRTKIRHKYGLTECQYDALMQRQGGLCAACGVTLADATRYVHIDHCHETRRVRGILCNGCNVALGHAREDVNVLMGLISYLGRCKADLDKIGPVFMTMERGPPMSPEEIRLLNSRRSRGVRLSPTHRAKIAAKIQAAAARRRMQALEVEPLLDFGASASNPSSS